MDKVASEVKEESINQKNTPTEIKHALYKEYHNLPLEMNKIVCSNFHGKGYGCNVKYIVEELLKREPKLDIVWLVAGKYDFPEGVRTVPFNSAEALQEIATARVLIDNQMKFIGFKKRKDQFYINTWHGAIPLKKIGFDNPSNKGKKKYEKRVDLNFDNIDLITSNSRFCTDLFRRSFHYRGNILVQGCPRNDLFFQERSIYKKKVYEALQIPENKKLVLYAPTFRSDKTLDAYQMDYEKVLNNLGEEWVIVLRLHPHVQKQANTITYNDRIFNGSVYPDMQELMAASDIMITDYSNIMFEFLLSERPCFIYATDIEEYRKQRDYYFDIYDLPFPVATNSDELVKAMTEFEQEKYKKKMQKFWRKVKMKETGQASKYVADLIMGMIFQKDFDLSKEVKRINWKNFMWRR